jgi:acetylornithine deacetylase/succinyl-diaminopimelate desuccinylase-like protein
MRECLQWFARERQWINEQHLKLCRVPAPTFLEQKRAEYMVQQFRSLGCEARIDRAGNVIALAEGNPQGPYLALTAHLDTVLAPRVPEDISIEGDGRMRGPGVADNGAGLAALLAIARALKTTRCLESAPASVLFVANVGEEGEGNLSGMRYLCKPSALSNKIRAFLILDGPATDHITCQALASKRFEVLFQGSGGHSWSDFGTGNPVHALARAITSFTESCSEIRPSSTPRSSFNFGVIDGGSTVNSIPTEARAKVDIRSESSSQIDHMASLLSTCVERSVQAENDRAYTGRVTARLKEIGFRPGGRLEENSAILGWMREVDSYLGIRAHLDCASTDANIPLSLGVPAVSIGAGGQGGGAHTPGEWFHPEGRELGLRRIALMLGVMLAEISAESAAGVR